MKPKSRKIERSILILTISLILAVIVNFALLAVMDQKSGYRATHSLVGIVMLVGFVFSLSGNRLPKPKLVVLMVVALVPCYFGTVIPDLDIRFFGIGAHRNPIFHSGLYFFALLIVTRDIKPAILTMILIGFGVGVGSHLIWDMFDFGDVRWIPGGTLDRTWLGANGILCVALARVYLAPRLTKNNNSPQR